MSLLISRLGTRSSSVPGVPDPLILEFIDTSPARIAIASKTEQSVIIDWGDGSTNTVVTAPGVYSHLYATNSSTGYYVTVSGGLVALGANPADVESSEPLLLSIENPGLIGVVSFGNLPTFTTPRFIRSQYLTYVPATLSPYFTDLSGMFYQCDSINDANITLWDTSNVQNMSHLLRTAIGFTHSLSDWDVSSVTNMDWMFDSAFSFNHDLSGWCVPLIPSLPAFFGSAGWPSNYVPIWGTCPVRCFAFYDSVLVQFDSSLMANGSTTVVDTGPQALTPSAISGVSALDGWLVALVNGYMHYALVGLSFDLGVGSVYTAEIVLKVAPNSSGSFFGFEGATRHTYTSDSTTLDFATVGHGTETPTFPLELAVNQEYHYALTRYGDGTGRIFLDGLVWKELSVVPDMSGISGFGVFGVFERLDLLSPGLSVKAFRFTHSDLYYSDFTPPSSPFPPVACLGPPVPTCFPNYQAVSLQLDMTTPSGVVFVDTGPYSLSPTFQSDVAIFNGYGVASTGYLPSLMYAASNQFNNSGQLSLEFYLTIDAVVNQDRYFCGQDASLALRIEAYTSVVQVVGWLGTGVTPSLPVFTIGQEYHVCLQSDGLTGFIFVDGTTAGSYPSLTGLESGPVSFNPFSVSGGSAGLYGAKIRGLRISKSVNYDPGFSFIPPSLPLPTLPCVTEA